MRVTKHVEVQVDLVDEFCEAGSDEQASFLSGVAKEFGVWGGHDRDSQLLSIGAALRELSPDDCARVRHFFSVIVEGIPS